MPLPFDSRNENIFQRLGAWAILVTSGHAYRYDIVKSRGPQKSTGSPEVERVRQDVTVLHFSGACGEFVGLSQKSYDGSRR